MWTVEDKSNAREEGRRSRVVVGRRETDCIGYVDIAETDCVGYVDIAENIYLVNGRTYDGTGKNDGKPTE